MNRLSFIALGLLFILIAALDHAVAATRKAPLETSIYPRPRGSCQELARAATMVNQRFEPSPKPPGTPGEAVIFLNALGSRESFRPPDWENTVAGLLQHEIPYVRETALNSVPVPLPASVRKLIPARLLDADVNVQIAACNLAGKTPLPEFKEAALKVLATAREQWLLNAVENALWELGVRFESIEVLVGRLDDREMTVWCLSRLSGWVIADHSTGSTPAENTFDAEQAKVVKARWRQFVHDHGNALRAGKRFSVGDPALTPELFPNFEFYPRRGSIRRIRSIPTPGQSRCRSAAWNDPSRRSIACRIMAVFDPRGDAVCPTRRSNSL